jgi:hypothetical protein
MAFAAITALGRRHASGGSWHARLSLAQTGHWLRSLGRIEDGTRAKDPTFDDVRDLTEQCDSPFGQLTLVRSPAQMALTPVRWDTPPLPLGVSPPAWP